MSESMKEQRRRRQQPAQIGPNVRDTPRTFRKLTLHGLVNVSYTQLGGDGMHVRHFGQFEICASQFFAKTKHSKSSNQTYTARSFMLWVSSGGGACPPCMVATT